MSVPGWPDKSEDNRMHLEETDEGEAPIACPAPEFLEALHSGKLSDAEALLLEAHLAACPTCLARLLGSPTTTATSPVVAAGRVWGSAIACAVFGPKMLPRSTFLHLRSRLHEQGSRVAEKSEPALWAAVDVSSGGVTGDPVNATQLISFLRQLAALIRPDTHSGAIVDVGRGRLDRLGPYGEVFDSLPDLAVQIRPGEVLITAEVIHRVEPLGFRLRRYASGLAQVIPVAEEPNRIDRLASLFGRAIRGWWGGPLADIAAIGVHSDVARAHRTTFRGGQRTKGRQEGRWMGEGTSAPRAESSVPALSLEPEDRLSVQYEAPADGWLYLLSCQDGRVTALFSGHPIRTPDDPERGAILVQPPMGSGPLRLFLLITCAPARHILELCEKLPANPSDLDGSLVNLGEQLMAVERQGSFLLLEAGSFVLKQSSR